MQEIRKVAVVLACIQRAIEYENDVGAHLAAALAVVRAILTAVAARIVGGDPKEGGSQA